MAQEIIKNICQASCVDFESLSIESISKNIIYVQRLNWDYLNCLAFQEACVDYVYQNPEVSILIGTNHPHCLTLGRGLQKKVGDETSLVDFSDAHKSRVQIPIYEIKRGGGITFHYPGQVIIYPIINLTRHQIKVYGLMNRLMQLITETLTECYGAKDYDFCRDLLGLWVKNNKIASIGLQVRRFVTFHGIALNFSPDSLIDNTLKVIYPCGLPGTVYQSLEELYLSNQKLLIKDLFNSLKNKWHLIFENDQQISCQK